MTALRITTRLAPAARSRPTGVPGRVSRASRWLATHLTDEWLVASLAAVLSGCAYAWYTSRGLTFGYSDALSRMMIARRVVVSRTPGLAQLGTTWPALNSFAMLPLIWNNTLFHDGFAGAFPSMVAYVLICPYMLRMVKLVSGSRLAAWVAALTLMLNPSLLYLQSTAMSEVPMVAAATVGVYYMLRWAKSYYALDLVKSAAAVAAGTGIRYDGWALAAAFTVVVVIIAWRLQGFRGVQAWGILYALLGFAGCAAWVIYNAVIFHDPMLFLFYGSTSHSTSYMARFPQYHHALMSFEMFGFAAGSMVGAATVVLFILGLVVFAVRGRLRSSALPAYALLVPIAYHYLILYTGFDTILLPQLGLHIYWNARFGIELIPGLAFFVGVLVGLRRVFAVVALGAIAWFAVANLTVQKPFALLEPLATEHGVTAKMGAKWLISHYHGGGILISYVPDAPSMFYMMQDIPDLDFLTDANGAQFRHALKYPQLSVKWVIMDQNDATNRIWVALHGKPVLKRYFVLRRQVGSTMFYQRVGARRKQRHERAVTRSPAVPHRRPPPRHRSAPVPSLAPVPRLIAHLLPGSAGLEPPVAIYTTKPGDTLSAIAARYRIPDGWRAIYRVNRRVIGDNPGRIRIGQRLELP